MIFIEFHRLLSHILFTNARKQLQKGRFAMKSRISNKRYLCMITILSILLLLMGCAAQPQGEEPEGPMEDTPQTLAIEGYETGVLPCLRVYRQAAEDGTWDYSYYVCTWEPHSGQLSQGEPWQTEDGGLGRTRPASWQAQCVMSVNGRRCRCAGGF